MVETSPAPGAVLDYADLIDTVTITLHTNVNASVGDISLVGANTGPKAFTLTSGTNVNPLILNLAAALVPDAYTLTVTDGVNSVASGMALDGEVSDPASLPSGDGTEGGDAVIEFVIDGEIIPTISQWGLVVLALLLLTSGTIIARIRRVAGSAIIRSAQESL